MLPISPPIRTRVLAFSRYVWILPAMARDRRLERKARRTPVAFAGGTAAELARLFDTVRSIQAGETAEERTARLLASGRIKIAKKVVEEAAEIGLSYVAGDRDEVVREAADLFYNLVVLLVSMDVSIEEVWQEMERRQALMGIAGKMPKQRPDSGDKAASKPDPQADKPSN